MKAGQIFVKGYLIGNGVLKLLRIRGCTVDLTSLFFLLVCFLSILLSQYFNKLKSVQFDDCKKYSIEKFHFRKFQLPFGLVIFFPFSLITISQVTVIAQRGVLFQHATIVYLKHYTNLQDFTFWFQDLCSIHRNAIS